MKILRSLVLPLLIAAAAISAEERPKPDTSRGDRMIADYFRHETQQLAAGSLTDVKDREAWEAQRPVLRQQLFEMLGLDPLPDRTDLNAVVTGTITHDDFTVEKLHFQSRPGLYVTGNLYLPKGLLKPAPTVLYLCGHGQVKKDGVSYGNKVHYQHHGSWFARHGYICLAIDTLQLGEIEGLHHGTHRENMWWWNSRGYTPAGVEAWNCIRALDYLATRSEVDRTKIGVTGRSGGGAYSWYIAALDERIQVAVPVAGITDLTNHIVDGVVEGHCDCMFMVNTYRWDYARLAALIAPRPLLLTNTDRDPIFPLDGVQRIHWQLRHLYGLYKSHEKLGLQISAGGHSDTQELQVAALQWFNVHLKGKAETIADAATKEFTSEQLKVFETLPSDQENARIQESFTQTAEVPSPPASRTEWEQQRETWRSVLLEKCFRGWPKDSRSATLDFELPGESHDLLFIRHTLQSQDKIKLPIYLLCRSDLAEPSEIELNILDEDDWHDWVGMMRVAFAEQLTEETGSDANEAAFAKLREKLVSSDRMIAYFAPRGIGPTAWDQTPKKQTQHRRRFMLLGQTLDSMRVWDVRRAMQAVRNSGLSEDAPLHVRAEGHMHAVALYASLFEPAAAQLDLVNLPVSHRTGPDFLNVLRYLDMPQALAMAAERTPVRLHNCNSADWQYAVDVVKSCGWDDGQIQFLGEGATEPD